MEKLSSVPTPLAGAAGGKGKVQSNQTSKKGSVGQKKPARSKAATKGAAAGGLLALVPVPVAAAVVVGAVAYFGVKLLKGSGKGENGDEADSSRATENGVGHLRDGVSAESQNGAANSEQTGSEIVETVSKVLAANGTAREPLEGSPRGGTQGNAADSTTGNMSPAPSPFRLQVSVGLSPSPFNTAPNSPLYPPDSPFHDAAGELDFEEYHGDRQSTPGKPSSFSDWIPEKGDVGRPNGLQNGTEDSDKSTVTNESKEQGNCVGSPEGERASVQALLARARAAAARVDKMHASINAMVNNNRA